MLMLSEVPARLLDGTFAGIVLSQDIAKFFRQEPRYEQQKHKFTSKICFEHDIHSCRAYLL